MNDVDDFREKCVWYERGYCKLQSVCVNGKFFSEHKNLFDACSLFDLKFRKSDVMDRVVVEQELVDVWKRRKGFKKFKKIQVQDVGDKALGIKFLKKVLKDEWGIDA